MAATHVLLHLAAHTARLSKNTPALALARDRDQAGARMRVETAHLHGARMLLEMIARYPSW